MNKNFIVFAILLSLLAFADFSSALFEGTWLDSRGYTVSLCTTDDGRYLHGTYNQFGVIQGEITPDGLVAQGRWYEARNPFSTCPLGGFTFRLQNSNHWEGNFDCSDAHLGPNQNTAWNADRFSPDIQPTYVECGVINKTNNQVAEGAWVPDLFIPTNWDICFGVPYKHSAIEKYYSSYECDSALNCYGYEEGFFYENGKLLVGEFTNVYPTSTTVDGTAITLLLNDSTLVHYQWGSPISTTRVISGSQHVAQFNITYANLTHDSLCYRNNEIYHQLYRHYSVNSRPYYYTLITKNYYGVYEPGVYYASSSTLSCSLALLFATLFIALF